MAHPAAALVESALKARKLDRTLTTALPPLERTDPSALVPTEAGALDTCLRGGLPRGQLSEIAGPASSGRTTLLWQVLSGATRRGELVAYVDTCDRLDVSSLTAAGPDLERVLWIRGQAVAGSLMLDRAVDRAIKALNLVLQAGGFGVVALDLADVPRMVLRRIPFTTWLRVQRTIEGSDTACVLLTPEPFARSAGGLTVSLTGRTAWTGDSARSQRIEGLDLTAHVIASRQHAARGVDVRARVAGA
jgi:hypothetical protein